MRVYVYVYVRLCVEQFALRNEIHIKKKREEKRAIPIEFIC